MMLVVESTMWLLLLFGSSLGCEGEGRRGIEAGRGVMQEGAREGEHFSSISSSSSENP